MPSTRPTARFAMCLLTGRLRMSHLGSMTEEFGDRLELLNMKNRKANEVPTRIGHDSSVQVWAGVIGISL